MIGAARGASEDHHTCLIEQVDRLGATEERCGEVESSIFDLFAHLGATEEQLDFPVLYASARQVHLHWECASLNYLQRSVTLP